MVGQNDKFHSLKFVLPIDSVSYYATSVFPFQTLEAAFDAFYQCLLPRKFPVTILHEVRLFCFKYE